MRDIVNRKRMTAEHITADDISEIPKETQEEIITELLVNRGTLRNLNKIWPEYTETIFMRVAAAHDMRVVHPHEEDRHWVRGKNPFDDLPKDAFKRMK